MTRAIYAAPWAEPLVEPERVELVEYGPTAPTQARQYARHREWSGRPSSRRPRVAGRDVVAEFMRFAGATEVPAREREVFEVVHVHGHSTRWAARALGLSRSAVATYLRRLRERAVRWRARRDDAEPRPTAAARALARHAERVGRSWAHLRARAAA